MNKLILWLMLVCFATALSGQIRPRQLKKADNPKQTVLLSDGSTGVFDYAGTGDGMILPYNTTAAAAGEYDQDAIVTFGGYIYRSQTDNNLTTPGVGTWERISGPTTGGGGSATNIAFDGNRQILRVPGPGDNIGTDSIKQWLEWWYFTPPTWTLNSLGDPVEMGGSYPLTLAGSASNPGAASLSNGELRQTSPASALITSIGSGSSVSTGITFTPQQGGSGIYNEDEYSFRISQDWTFGSENGTANSPTRTKKAVYPVFYGVSATDLSVGGDPYTALSKLVEDEGDKTVANGSPLNMNGTGFSYIAVPKTWTDFDLSRIADHNDFTVTGSYTAYDITISSTGQVNDYTAEPYKLYKSNTSSTFTNYEYSIYR